MSELVRQEILLRALAAPPQREDAEAEQQENHSCQRGHHDACDLLVREAGWRVRIAWSGAVVLLARRASAGGKDEREHALRGGQRAVAQAGRACRVSELAAAIRLIRSFKVTDFRRVLGAIGFVIEPRVALRARAHGTR